MKKSSLGAVAAVTAAALTAVALVRGLLPDVRRYLRISRM
ncbi:DUF6893 family small protein [Streptomyces sp. NPDC090127]